MKKWKKRTLISCVCCLLVIALVWNITSTYKYDYSSLIPRFTTGAAKQFESMGTDPQVGNMQIAAQNDSLELCINPKTTEIAVKDKRTGNVWYSNPQGRNSNGASADALSSQMYVTYFDTKRNEMQYSSYSDSVKKNQFKIESLDGGVKVTYTMGTMTVEADSIPKYMSKARLNALLSKVKTEDDKDAISESFTEDTAKPGRMIFMDSAKQSDIIMGQIIEGLKEAGYTSKDLKIDNAQAGIQTQSEASYFTIPLEYQLVDDKLSVTVPSDQIVEKGGDKILYMEPLEYFGAGSTKDNGYLFVPSGCGGLINFNNGKKTEQQYIQSVYGEDYAAAGHNMSEISEPIRMPVFGLKKGNAAVFAYIDNGDGDASIIAGVSGTACPYNYVHPRFTLRTTDKVALSQASGTVGEMKIVENASYKGPFNVKYCFLKQNDADYSGMARYYRDILTKNGTLKPLSKTDGVPFYLDVLGAVEKDKYFVGVPYQGVCPMTTYQQAGDILSAFRKSGVKNIQMRYLGWFNGGINNNVPRSIDMISRLGGKNDLQSLEKNLSSNGGRLYLDAALQQVAYNTPHYDESKESARYLDQWAVENCDDNMATISFAGLPDNAFYDVVSPNSLPGLVDNFLSKFEKLGVKGLSLRDMGSLLISDKRDKYPINREISKYIVIDQLKKMAKNNQLIISGGNNYSLPYANSFVDVPSTGNNYYLLDQVVPFYEMVVHGSVDYSGEAANISSSEDVNSQILHMMEYGLTPHYLVSYQDGSELKDTAFEKYYSTGYQNWLSDAAEAYQQVDSVYSQLRTAKIQQYKICQKGVSETVYDNGVTVYVNHTAKPVTIGSVTINANGYTLGGSRN